jgi:hypothetical protein
MWLHLTLFVVWVHLWRFENCIYVFPSCVIGSHCRQFMQLLTIRPQSIRSVCPYVCQVLLQKDSRSTISSMSIAEVVPSEEWTTAHNLRLSTKLTDIAGQFIDNALLSLSEHYSLSKFRYTTNSQKLRFEKLALSPCTGAKEKRGLLLYCPCFAPACSQHNAQCVGRVHVDKDCKVCIGYNVYHLPPTAQLQCPTTSYRTSPHAQPSGQV